MELRSEATSIPSRLAEFLELAGSAYLSYKLGVPEEKRDLLRIATSNRLVYGKNVDVVLSQPFCEVANRFKTSNGAPYRDIPRTWDRLIDKLCEFLKLNPTARLSVHSDLNRDNSAEGKSNKTWGLAA
jgi:hypothetical protein